MDARKCIVSGHPLFIRKIIRKICNLYCHFVRLFYLCLTVFYLYDKILVNIR
jgi:hypothetical protein